VPIVRLSPRAEADFDSIVDYLAQNAGVRIAENYGRSIQSAVNRLSEFPAIGSPRPALASTVRVIVIAPYLIFYEVEADNSVLVLRILHGHRKITGEMLRRT